MKKNFIRSVAIVAFSLFAASNAFAQSGTGGFDAIVSLNIPVVDFDHSMTVQTGDTALIGNADSDGTQTMVGFGGSLSFGYRWSYVGVYLQQDLNGVWFSDDDNEDDNGHFLGGTFLVVRGILPASQNFQIDVGFGLGVMYSDGDKSSNIMSEDYKLPLIFNKDGDPSAAFAIKVNAAFTYYITPTIGLGINFDYNCAFNTITYEQKSMLGTIKMDVDNYVHLMTPGIHVRARF